MSSYQPPKPLPSAPPYVAPVNPVGIEPVYRPPIQPVAYAPPIPYTPQIPYVAPIPPVPPGPPKQSWTAMFTFGIIAWLVFAFLCIIFAIYYGGGITCSSVPETCGQFSYNSLVNGE